MRAKTQKPPLLPTSVTLDARTRLELRRRAARETLRSGRAVTASALVRQFVEKALFDDEDQVAAEAGK